MTRICKLSYVACLLCVACGVTRADWFELPSRAPATRPSGSSAAPAERITEATLPQRCRDVEAPLSDHAVYFAFADLGIGGDKMSSTVARLAQTPSVAGLPPEKAFLVGGRFCARLNAEMDRVATPARAAAAKSLSDIAEQRCSLRSALPRETALRFEMAISVARQAIRSQGVRLEFSKWLEEAVKEVGK